LLIDGKGLAMIRQTLPPSAVVGKPLAVCVGICLGPVLVCGCDAAPATHVVLQNAYPAPTGAPIVVYAAQWQAVSFPTPLSPGESSQAQLTVPAADNTAYAVLAPDWNPDAGSAPASLIVVQSQQGYSVHLDDTLTIPVDDTTFAGRCGSGSPALLPSEAEFLTQTVFPSLFAGLRYDAATCTTTPAPDSGAP
jgi:hypothetical protein